MEYVFFWLLFGVITAVIGANKGRSAGGFFFLGLLLGPIGIILALVMKPNHAKKEQIAVATGQLRKCPHCAEMIKREATICKHCRSQIAAPGAAKVKAFGIDSNDINKRLAKCECGRGFRYTLSESGKAVACPGCSSNIVLP